MSAWTIARGSIERSSLAVGKPAPPPADTVAMALDREAESSELATLVAGMAHEVNNPITYVLGNLRELHGSCAAIAETLAGYRRELRLLAGESAPARIDDLEAKLREAGGLELVDELVTDAGDGAVRI